MIRGRTPRPFRYAILLAGTFFLAGNRGCEGDPLAKCQGEFADLSAEVTAFRAEGLHPDSRERCQTWARRRLLEVQVLLDFTMQEPGRRPAAIDLNQMATDLVMIHGACEKGDGAALDRELSSLEKSLPLVEEKACAPGLATPDRVNP